MRSIESRQNRRLKQLKKLKSKKGRSDEGLFLAEGEDLFSAGIAAGRQPVSVFVRDDALDEMKPLLDKVDGSSELFNLSGDAVGSLSELGSGTRLISVWQVCWQGPAALRGCDFAVFLDGISDPANVGAILRCVDALADGTVVCGPRTADPFSPKAVRASMGSVFSQPLVCASLKQTVAGMGEGCSVIALDAHRGVALEGVDLSGKAVLCLGAERSGLSGESAALAGQLVHIPLREHGAESLNVSMATAIALYRRSRIGATDG